MLQFNVNKQIITRLDGEQPVGNSSNYLTAVFDFSPDWNGTTKTVYFKKVGSENDPYFFILDEDDEIKESAHLNLEPGTWGMYAWGVDGTKEIPTNTIQIFLKESGVDNGEPYPIKPSTFGDWVKEKIDWLLAIIKNDGDGTKYLSDDGTYKTVSGGGFTQGDNITITDSVISLANPLTINAKTDMANADSFVMTDSADTGKTKKYLLSALITKLTNFFSGLFAPITFSTVFSLERTGTNTANLVNTAPVANSANYMEVANTTNTTINWTGTQKLVITRVLTAPLTLNPLNSFLFTMKFAISADSILEFGARTFIDGVQIASNQTFGIIDAQGAATYDIVNEYNATIKVDMIASTVTYPAGAVMVTEVFKRQDGTAPRTTRYFCGVLVNSEYRNAVITASISSVSINTSNLMDGSVTKPKLSTEVQATLDLIVSDGDGTKYFSDDGTYKTVTSSTYTAGTGIDITDNVISATGSANAEILEYIPYYPVVQACSYWNRSGALIVLDPSVTDANKLSATKLVNYIPVIAGDKFRITLDGIYSGTNPSQIVFLNDSNVFVANAWSNNTSRNNVEITVPTNATRMHVTFFGANTFKIDKIASATETELSRIRQDFIKFENESLMKEIQNFQQNVCRPTFKEFAKGYITFVNDDTPTNIDVFANVFETANIPLCMATIYTNAVSSTSSLGLETKIDTLKRIVANGGEILSHMGTVITADNIDNYDVLYEQFANSKKVLESYGFEVNGIILAGGIGFVSGDTKTDKWARRYYKYSDQYGQTAYGYPYFHGRTNLVHYTTIEEIKAVIDNTILNKEWTVLYFHNFAEISQTLLEQTLAYINTLSSTDLECLTYKEMYDKHITANISASGGIVLESIDAVKTKTTYTVGDALNIDDITAMANYSNDVSYVVDIRPEDIDTSAVTMSGNILTTSGGYSIKISYSDNGIEVEDAVSITVFSEAVTLTGFTASKVVTSYVQGSVMDTTDITGVATFSDSSTQNLTYNSLIIPSFDMNTVGTRNLAVEYTFNGTTLSYNIPITITRSVVASGIVKNSSNADAGTWTLYSDYELVINGVVGGVIMSYTTTSQPWNAYLSQITKITYTGTFTSTGANVAYNATALTTVVLNPNIVTISGASFQGCTALANIDLTGITSIAGYAFRGATGLPSTLVLGATSLSNDFAYANNKITAINFLGTPTSISATAFTNITGFNSSANLLNIRVPWASGAVANAPWGATAATITYNWTP